MATVRVTNPCVVTPLLPDGTFGLPVSLRLGAEFDVDDLVVQQHRYAFGVVEDASAVPGERRTTRRPA